MARKRSISRLMIFSTLMVVLLVAAAIFYGLWNSGRPRLSADEALQLVHTKNVGLGQLENQKLDDALKTFEAIRTAIPGDPLTVRNIAVARVTELGSEGDAPPAEALELARSALAGLKAEEGETTAYHWLGLQVALIERARDQADRHLQALLKENPNNAAVHYARFRVLQAAESSDSAEVLDALTKATQAAPENLWLQVEWLRAAGQQLVRGDGSQAQLVSQQLAATREAVQPLEYVIRTYARVDAMALLDQAAASLGENNATASGARLLTLANVLLPHAAGDQRLVRPHPLEFVQADFSPKFYTAYPLAADSAPAAIEVKFVDKPAELVDSMPEKPFDVAIADFDLDGQLDVFLLGEKTLSIWSRQGDGTWRSLAAIENETQATGITLCDLDADFDETLLAVQGSGEKPGGSPALKNRCPSADVDVVLFGTAGIQLLENRFARATKRRELVASKEMLPATLGEVRAVEPVDLEADGDLDLAIAAGEGLHFWATSGPWNFVDISSRSKLPPKGEEVTQILPLDFDRDVDVDLLIANPQGAGWLENLRHGQFRWRAFAEGFEALASAHALEVTDADGNASWDVIGASGDKLVLVTTSAPSPGMIVARESKSVANVSASHLQVLDYDNDGYDDLLAWSQEQMQLFRSTGGGAIAATDLVKNPKLQAAQFGDLDGDGDLDLAAVANGGLTIITNVGGNANHWIEVALQAQQIKGQQHSPSGRVSPFGNGSLLELKAGPRYQAKAVRGQATHFGLGQATEADVIRVVWLNGVPQNVLQPAADLFVCEQQVLNTSCPYLYTWDGEQFVFATDLLWNAPLGLLFAEGVLAPPRDWEYLKIAGEQLQPRDGHYELQVTEELWEAVYFDQIRLIAVDHPADVAIYSNEKVGPPDIAEHKIHTVRQPRLPVSAKNQDGRNVLPEISAADGNYARIHEHKLRQGVVEECYLELDLGNIAGTRQVTLFLMGWLYPSSTSINVGLSQGGPVPPPNPPALLVADGQGGWKAALPFMGFPGGKTKTVAIDLTGQLAENDARLRIATTMEFYWDQIFFTVDEAPAEFTTSDLKLVSADLHERGFSRVVPDTGNGPEKFLYHELSTAAKWPAMQGAFTRLGDVRELLTARDDRLLVMGAGDEVTLRFAVPSEPLPPGWKRDFLIYNVGWEKDCNLLTVLGEQVDPSPFAAMQAYPWQPEEKLPSSEEHSAYLRKYQTRTQTGSFWRSVRDYAK